MQIVNEAWMPKSILDAEDAVAVKANISLWSHYKNRRSIYE